MWRYRLAIFFTEFLVHETINNLSLFSLYLCLSLLSLSLSLPLSLSLYLALSLSFSFSLNLFLLRICESFRPCFSTFSTICKSIIDNESNFVCSLSLGIVLIHLLIKSWQYSSHSSNHLFILIFLYQNM